MRLLVLEYDLVVNVIEAEEGFDPGDGLTTLPPPGDHIGIGWQRSGEDWLPPPPEPIDPQFIPAVIDSERDRRISQFTFNGVAFQLDPASQQRIIAMGADARFAIALGAQPGDMRWADPEVDFGWIATDNSIAPMDAPMMVVFADAAKLWVSRHIFAARALKDADPIPEDITDDQYWP